MIAKLSCALLMTRIDPSAEADCAAPRARISPGIAIEREQADQGDHEQHVDQREAGLPASCPRRHSATGIVPGVSSRQFISHLCSSPVSQAGFMDNFRHVCHFSTGQKLSESDLLSLSPPRRGSCKLLSARRLAAVCCPGGCGLPPKCKMSTTAIMHRSGQIRPARRRRTGAARARSGPPGAAGTPAPAIHPPRPAASAADPDRRGRPRPTTTSPQRRLQQHAEPFPAEREHERHEERRQRVLPRQHHRPERVAAGDARRRQTATAPSAG